MRPLTIDTVLVATDLSGDDLPALGTALELSRLAGAHLHVVHAGEEEPETRQRLDDHIRQADPASSVLPGTTLRAGPADRVIVDVAAMIDADVIVLGPHRPGAANTPDSTAYQVAARSERPCLVLPAALQLPLGRILVPIDASGAARGALAVGLTWGSALRRRAAAGSSDATGITVLHIVTPDAADTDADALMDSALAAAGERVTSAAGVSVTCMNATAPHAADAILERAADMDLVVLGTRAQHSDRELGSVSAAVVARAACPVLLVPPRIWRREQGS